MQCLTRLTVSDVELRQALHQDFSLRFRKDGDDQRVDLINVARPFFDSPKKRLCDDLVTI